MKVEFDHETRTLEAMLKNLAQANGIEYFNLLIHTPEEFIDESDEDALVKREGRIISVHVESIDKDTFSTKRDFNEIVSLCSKVYLKGEWDGNLKHDLKSEKGLVHLRQLNIDLKDTNAEKSLKSFKGIFKKIYSDKRNYHGSLVFSGKGFHYYGSGLLSEKGFKKWIDSAKQTGMIGKDWCDSQLDRKYSILRVSRSKLKNYDPSPKYEVKIC